jgi:hypothetical protein
LLVKRGGDWKRNKLWNGLVLLIGVFFFVGHMVEEKDVPALIKLFKKLYPEAFLSCPHAERKFIFSEIYFVFF